MSPVDRLDEDGHTVRQALLDDDLLIRLAANPGDPTLRTREIEFLLENCPVSQRRLAEFTSALQELEPAVTETSPDITRVQSTRSSKRSGADWALFGLATAAAMLVGVFVGRTTSIKEVVHDTLNAEAVLTAVAAGDFQVARQQAEQAARRLTEARRASELIAMLDESRTLAVADLTARDFVGLPPAFVSKSIDPETRVLDEAGTPGSPWVDRVGEALWKAARQEPGNTAAALALGNWLLQYNKYDEALVEFQRALSADPENRQANLGCGLAHFRNRHYADAIPYLERANSAWPEHQVIAQLLLDARTELEEGPDF